MASSLSLNVKISFLVGSSLFFVDDCTAVSCDFSVFVRGGELKSFYPVIFSRTKELLLVWMFAAFSLIMCRPLSP